MLTVGIAIGAEAIVEALGAEMSSTRESSWAGAQASPLQLPSVAKISTAP